MLRKVLPAVVATAAVLFGFSAPAHAGPATSTSPRVCGFWENAEKAYYTHCAAPAVMIRVDVAGWGSSNDACRIVGHGDTYLGTAEDIINAYYLSNGICNI